MENEHELYQTPAPVDYMARGGGIHGLMTGYRYGIVTNRRLYFEDKERVDQFPLSRIQSLDVISGNDPFLQIDLTDGCRIRVSLSLDMARRLVQETTGGDVKQRKLLIPVQESVIRELSSKIRNAMSSFQPERVRPECPLAGQCTCGCALCYISGPARGASPGYHCGTHRAYCHARCM